MRKATAYKAIGIFLILLIPLLFLFGCSPESEKPLPPAEPDAENQFGVDANINMETIDDYLGRSDVAYRDVRMLFDPANYEAIGGEADLTRTIEGFKVVPFPFIATLGELPVEGAYQGPSLFDVIWAEDGTVESSTANYKEADLALEELFPKDKAIFIMCGGGGYSGMLRQFLIHKGWDPDKVYNTGANWGYDGDYRLELIIYPEVEGDDLIYATWRADYAYIDFDKLNPVEQQ